MNVFRGGFQLFALVLVAAPAVYANCYVLENRTDTTIKLQFDYNGPVGSGTVTAVELVPNGRYPVRGQWCWDTRPDQWAKVIVATTGNFRPSWEGQLVLGNGGPAYASGRYSLIPTRRNSENPRPRSFRPSQR